MSDFLCAFPLLTNTALSTTKLSIPLFLSVHAFAQKDQAGRTVSSSDR